MESSKEIEKMFYQDSFYKKKIGSNVHRRVGKGSEGAGVAGGVKFAKNNFKKYEKNSRVNKYNMFETVLEYEKFNKFNTEEQKELLFEWMNRYTNVDICREWGIAESTFYNILNKLNVRRSDAVIKVDEELMKKYKDGDIKPHEFRTLSDEQKVELVDYWQEKKGMTNKEMANIVDYALNSFTTNKSKWRKAVETNKAQQWKSTPERGENVMDDYKEVYETDVSEALDDDFGASIILSEPDNTNSDNFDDDNNNQETVNKFEFVLDGVFSGEEFEEKCKALGLLLGKKDSYKINLSIEENKS